ncbi:MAG: ornithine cyclodeaminase family protein [Woeseiaceae bacterium]
MILLDAKSVARALPRKELVAALAKAFTLDVTVPLRAHHEIPVANGNSGILLLMPSWSERHIGVKIVSVFPDNAKTGIPAVAGSYLLMDATTGVPVAMLDGTELTLQRTAAASALASTYLSRENSSRLLMVGTGNLAPHLIESHAAVRPITEALIWGRRPEAAKALADKISEKTYKVTVTNDLETAVRSADIVSCATLSNEPLILGEWLRAGQHVDLVGAFKPDMAEADVAAIANASVYVDTRAGALSESGELVQAIASGALRAESIKGSLRELASGKIHGRHATDEITLFKSVGTALEDLAAAELAVDNATT